jgi:pimeloyl-ACP methyl ester carboxylesterase
MKNKQHIIFCHGFASSAKATKAQFLQQKLDILPEVDLHVIDFNPTPIDFEYMTVTGMINRLRQYIIDRELAQVNLIGSSMGGLVALNYANRYAQDQQIGSVARLLLLAPALSYHSISRTDAELKQWQEQGFDLTEHYAFGKNLPLRYGLDQDGRFYTTPPPPIIPISIIHGHSDEIVPVTGSRDYAARYSNLVTLQEVEAGHNINDHLDLIWQEVQQFLLP